MKPAQLILLAGPSGSGKSTLAEQLTEELGCDRAALLSLDNYYRDLSHLPAEERDHYDFDQPEAWEHERILKELTQLKSRRAIDMPHYDFHTHLRRSETIRVRPVDYIIAEGIFALCYSPLNALADFRIYVDLDEPTSLHRRLTRDCNTRGRNEASIIRQFNAHVAPAIRTHIRPSAVHADLKLDGSAPLEKSTRQIRNAARNWLIHS
jgi:uridine kinase